MKTDTDRSSHELFLRTDGMPMPVDITHPAILIRIARAFRSAISAEHLFDVTRWVWVVGLRRNAAKLALGVFAGIVREVYGIEQWNPAGSTLYRVRPLTDVRRGGTA